jgi:polysaccharide export outer membrane protein
MSGVVADDYQIGAGDTLQISVWKEPDASVPSVVVRPDGRVTAPLIKDVAVAGLTPREAEKVIAEGLSKYIADANVTVVVTAIKSKKIYVIGGVRKEGPLSYTYGMTVLQALSEAGGLTDYAKRRKIYVLRTENGREYKLDFDYEQAVKGERPDQNVVLLPSDTVVIPH